MLKLDLLQTMTVAVLALGAGYGLCRRIRWLRAWNIPAAVVGGLLVALAMWAGRRDGVPPLLFDTQLQGLLMQAFFTTIGLHASVSLLRSSGRQVLLLLGMAASFALLQGLVGMAVASAFGLHPLFGVLAGTATLAGGPATGLAFAPLFEQAGVEGAATVATASAMAGIICGGLVGGPVAAWLMRHARQDAPEPGTGDDIAAMTTDAAGTPPGDGNSLKNLGTLLVAMALGALVSQGLQRLGLTLPGYIGAMLVAAALRNLDDRTGWIGLDLPALTRIGNVSLAFFLVMALMNLRLWELSGLALPLLVNLAVQVALVALFCRWPFFGLMGRDYDAAVMGGGFVGFMLGTTANAMAVMRTLAERYGPAPRAFLVAPLVGAFFIDFSNALIITGFLNLWR